MTDLGIVIVNYNTVDQLRRALHTLFENTGDLSIRVVVVDNASPDDSVGMVQREFPQAHVIASDTNGGFSIANNHGLRWLGFREDGVSADAPRYVLLLNPDTETPPGTLPAMVQFMDANPDVGISGPRLLQADGSLDLACRRSFPTPWVAFTHFSGLAKRFPDSPRFARYNLTFKDPLGTYDVDSVVGAFTLVRRECLTQIGLMDETFFMYGEDLDWCFRAKQAGWRVMYVGAHHLLHLKGTVGRRSAKAKFEFYRAMLIFYRKHFRRQTALPVHLLVLAAVAAKGGSPLLREVRTPSPLVPTPHPLPAISPEPEPEALR
ncbi:MAG: glycosyltransferase family 2 protein [Chloroflexi bacterium]|nr:glycosyltransferase family 2 protein [Chloroflexota bacterium]